MELEAIRWWLESTKFAAWHGTTGRGYSSRSCQTTFAEISIAVEMDAIIHLGGPDADPARKISLLRTATRFVMTRCQPKSNDPTCKKRLTYDGFFVQKKYIGSVEALVGMRLPGIFRGIAWR